MKKKINAGKKIFIGIFLIFYFISGSSLVLATGPDEPTGPQEPVGIQEQTGPTGPTSPTAPLEPVEEITSLPTETIENSESDQPVIAVDSDTPGENQTDLNSLDVSEADINNQNDATINNTVEIEVTTGENTVDNNSVVGDITTGDIDATVTLIDLGNVDLAPGSTVGVQSIDGTTCDEISLFGADERISLANLETGTDSENLNSIDNNNIIQIYDSSTADVNNMVDISANTGSNTISSNSSVGNVTTGDINLDICLINLLNLINPNLILTMDVWNILGGFEGDIIAPELANIATGPDSNNQNNLDLYTQEYIRAYQNANIENYFDFDVSTGGNTIGSNTVTGNISTGTTNINGNVTNVANVSDLPVFYIFNVYGEWDGSYNGIDPSRVIVNEINDSTGPDSDNGNLVENGSSANVTNENNANVSNQIAVDANTGLNNISNNTVVKDIETGAINISTNVVNLVNALSSATGQFALRIVNIFGDWHGDLASESDTASGVDPPAEPNISSASSLDNNLTSQILLGKTEEKTNNKKSWPGFVGQSINSGNKDDGLKSIGDGVSNQKPLGIIKGGFSKLGILAFFAGALLIVFAATWAIEKIINYKREELLSETKPVKI